MVGSPLILHTKMPAASSAGRAGSGSRQRGSAAAGSPAGGRMGWNTSLVKRTHASTPTSLHTH